MSPPIGVKELAGIMADAFEEDKVIDPFVFVLVNISGTSKNPTDEQEINDVAEGLQKVCDRLNARNS
jgi:hypothetical protein